MAERVDVGAIRRAQIVEAATRVITRKGFHNASLAEVESEAGISRGMMTYHFPTKDAMILAVFDSLIERLRLASSRVSWSEELTGRERIERRIDALVLGEESGFEVQTLLYTFLAQMPHRREYRDRLSDFYAALRDEISSDFRQDDFPGDHHDLAALLVAAFHGISVQHYADPAGLDPSRLVQALKKLLKGIFPAPIEE